MLCAIQLFCYVTFPAHSAAGCVDWGKMVKRRVLITDSSARGPARIDTVPNFKLRCLASSIKTLPDLVTPWKGNHQVLRASVHRNSAPSIAPLWGAADAEIKVPSVENTELKRSPFKAWCRSVYSHTCYAYCQAFLPCLFLPFRYIYLQFSKTSPDFFPVLAVANNTRSCVGPQNKIGHPAGGRFQCWVPAEYK